MGAPPLSKRSCIRQPRTRVATARPERCAPMTPWLSVLAPHMKRPAIDVASLREGAAPSRNALAARLIVRLVAALHRFEVQGFAAFADAYARHDLLRDRRVRVLAAGRSREGIAAGIDERGALIVHHGGAPTHYDSAEISVRAA